MSWAEGGLVCILARLAPTLSARGGGTLKDVVTSTGISDVTLEPTEKKKALYNDLEEIPEAWQSLEVRNGKPTFRLKTRLFIFYDCFCTTGFLCKVMSL